MNGKETVSKFLDALAKQDVQGMADVLAENIVFEMPFALPGLPDRVEGKGAVVEFLEQFVGKDRGIFTGWDLHNIRIYPGSLGSVKRRLNTARQQSRVDLGERAAPSG